MSAQTLEAPVFDPGLTYAVASQMPGKVDGFDKQGNPMDAGGRKLPVRADETFILQQGHIYRGSPMGGHVEHVSDPPKWVKDWLKQQQPFPGVTHPARVLRCPVPNCTFRTTRGQCLQEHKRLHRDVTPQEWARLEGGESSQSRGKFSEADFLPGDREALFGELTGARQSMPRRESPQESE